MLLFLMFFNASSVAMAILTARIAVPPYCKMPEWLEKLLTRCQKVDATQEDDPLKTVAGTLEPRNDNSVEKTEPDEVERRIKNIEGKWKSLADLANRIFFALFSVALIAMLLAMATTWQ